MNDKLLQKMTIFLLAIILLIPVFKVYAQESEVTVNVPSLKVRSGPGLTFDIIGEVEQNDKLTVIGKENDWLQVKYGNTNGWVAGWYTTSDSTEMTNKQVISKVNKLNVRKDPSLSSAVIGQIQEGTQLTTFKSEGQWIEISFQDKKGWVHSDYVSIVKQAIEKEPKTEQTTSTREIFVVSVDVLNVRAKADLSSKIIGQVSKSEQFKVITKDHNWVQIELENGKKGWVYSFYGQFAVHSLSSESTTSLETIKILYNGTNLRSESTTNSEVVARVNAGESFPVLEKEKDWYKIELSDKTIAYVASWVVSSSNSDNSSITEPIKERKKGTLQGVTLVIDAGHGGNDRGTTGALGTDEKDITLLTAELLASKLQAAGANVIMTRESDVYVDLRKRVSIGHQSAADAFVSLHYDAIENSSVRGYTTYYMHDFQKELATYVHKELGNMVSMKDRGTQPGNYLILRENKQKAILIELGFLSNPVEERYVTTPQFREQASLGIYNGIINYFDSQIN
ncbi:SH3 domain-containing protein [Psychrobacillus vulpis]|uniref:N-acetylmuramoyl-L-alanine amidase n=1 Tax=Psychrobacillus vulpis TaxID=2325572 RepID=A0A544TP46_9BACI|nr:SH3 domain-containing protein [Psychrobacillus vulpis]TQR19227.1 N-acetylmuramoyl-L-alanine amidase [Psychrobacillus vulpis]